MGIRFLCPNGHKLNVKADLAGKRAMCPTCGAKLVVPTESGGMAEASGSSSAELPLAAPAGVVVPPSTPAAPGTAPPGEPPPAGAWFVRPKSGGQFGPATDDVLSAWIREGRVAADAQVWRDGWPEWKLVRDAADALPTPLPTVTAPPVATPPPAAFGPDVEPPAEGPLPPGIEDEVAMPASRYRASRQRRNRLQVTLAVVMLAAILVLAAVLLWVLYQGGDTTESRLGIAQSPTVVFAVATQMAVPFCPLLQHDVSAP